MWNSAIDEPLPVGHRHAIKIEGARCVEISILYVDCRVRFEQFPL